LKKVELAGLKLKKDFIGEEVNLGKHMRSHISIHARWYTSTRTMTSMTADEGYEHGTRKY